MRLTAAVFAVLLTAGTAKAANNGKYVSARDLFNEAYRSAFGPQGSTFSYSVNIIGIYKTSGTVWMKGKKQYYTEGRYTGWNNGHDLYRLDKKKKEIEIHNALSPKRDKYASKFTFSPDDFDYSAHTVKNTIVITLTAKEHAKGNIKHAKIYLDRTTRNPVSLRIKVLFFWTTIKINNFHSGGVNDHIFNFSAAQYRGYRIVDKRPD